MAELCPCSALDWTGEDMTREHHRECEKVAPPSTEHLMKIADRLKAEGERDFPVPDWYRPFNDAVEEMRPLLYWRLGEPSRTTNKEAVSEASRLLSRGPDSYNIEFSCNTHGVYFKERFKRPSWQFFPCPECQKEKS